MWEKILLAIAVTFSLHIFAGVDLSDFKSPLASSSPVTAEDNEVPKLFSFQESVKFSEPMNINNLINK